MGYGLQHRKVILFIAESLDGYIAGPKGDMTFLSIVNREGLDYGYIDFINSVDTVIIGRKTYDWILTQLNEFPHSDKETYIITRKPQPAKGNIFFYTGGLKELVSSLKEKEGKNIFIDGGAEIVNGLLSDNLIDEFYISIVPVLLGAGVRLFNDGRHEQKLTLLEIKKYNSGLVQLHYTNSNF